MRPLHALLVFVLLAALGGIALSLLRMDGVTPAAVTAGPLSQSGNGPGSGSADGSDKGSEALLEPLGAAGPDALSAVGGSSRVAHAAPEPEAPDAPERAVSGSPAGRTRLSGRVVDAAGQPVAAASVALATHQASAFGFERFQIGNGARGARATTAADGTFELTSPLSGALRLAVRAAGYAPWDGPVRSLPDADAYALDPIVLERSVVLQGRVIDSVGRPVSGAEIVPSAALGRLGILPSRPEEGAALAVTDPDGAFRVDALAAGPYALVVSSDAHPSALLEGETAHSGEVRSGLVVELPRGAEIAGRVVGVKNSATGDLTVHATPRSASQVLELGMSFDPEREPRTAEVRTDGTFAVQGLLADREYTLALFERGGTGFTGPFGRSVSASVKARSGGRGVELAYRSEGAVLFQVVDAVTREPLEELRVEAGTAWPQPVTGPTGTLQRSYPDGRVRAGGLRPSPSERVIVRVKATGYAPWGRSDIELGSAQELDLGVVALEPIPTVRVRVVDGADATPIAGARVTLSPSKAVDASGGVRREVRVEAGADDGLMLGDSTAERTDQDGWAVLSSRPGEICSLSVKADGYAPSGELELALPVGRSFEQVVELGPGGTVVVAVVDSSGEPVAGEVVRRRMSGESSPTVWLGFGSGEAPRTNAEGRVRFEHLAPGEHEFTTGAGDANGMVFGGGPDASFAINVASFGDEEPKGDWKSATVVERGLHELTLVAPTKLTLSGRILEGGQPLVGATVRLTDRGGDDDESALPMSMGMPGLGSSDPTARTNGQGHYQFPEVTEGAYTLVISHSSRVMDARFSVDVRPGRETFDADLLVAIVEGRVTDGAGEPLEGVRVSVDRKTGVRRRMLFVAIDSGGGSSFSMGGSEGAADHTDSEGRYRLRGVRSGVSLVVKATGEGLRPAESEAFEVAPGAIEDDVDLVMQPGGELVVEVFGADGPSPRALVQAEYVGDEYEGVGREAGLTDEEGRARFGGLAPGTWKIKVSALGQNADSAPEQEAETEVFASETHSLRIDLE